MIKLSFFSLFSSFQRMTVEFHDEKALVKIKSLTYKQEFEFGYDEVAEIAYESQISESQMTFSLVVLVILSIVSAIFFPVLSERPWLFQTVRGLYILAAFLVLFSFLQRRYYYFLDKHHKILLRMGVTTRNYRAIAEAVELVGQKSGKPREMDFDHPFPSSEPALELFDYDVPNYFNTCQTRFYEEEFIEFDKSLTGASVTSCRYDQLSSTIDRFKKTSTSWDTLLGVIWMILIVLAGAYRAFAIPKTIFFSLAAVLAVLWVISLVQKFVKHEIIAFRDKNNRVVYFMWVKRSNQEKVEAIVQFIQSKIPVKGS